MKLELKSKPKLKLKLNILIFQIGNYANSRLTLARHPMGFENGVQPFDLAERPSQCLNPQQCRACKIWRPNEAPGSLGTASDGVSSTLFSNALPTAFPHIMGSDVVS